MSETLSFASYARCLKDAMKGQYNTQLKVTELLLEFLIVPDSDNDKYIAYGKDNQPIFVDKVMASNLFNKKENIHKNIQKNCDLQIVINGANDYFEDQILPKISVHMKDDLVRNIEELIETDASISKSKKREFYEKAESGDICGFLSAVFLYAVKKNNKSDTKAGQDRSHKDSKWNTNIQYYNSFVDNLFLHKEKNSKTIRLSDLYVMPRFKEMTWEGEHYPDYNILDYISRFVKYKFDDIRNGEILFIEGDAGVGKTSLVSYLTYHYTEQTDEWKKYFQKKNLLCIRLRDIIPVSMKFSSDTIVKDILYYLDLETVEAFKNVYKDTIIVLDGFDELCMVEGINSNSAHYIYQIYNAFSEYKIIVTTRPQYLDILRLDLRHRCISLLHFDAAQRRQWIENYKSTGLSEYEKYGIEYVSDEENDELNSICDTPMVLYMIVAGRINEEAKHNIWVLYHQIFYKELADTEYNSMFVNSEGIYSHGIKKHSEILYRLSSEIAYRMFCSGNTKLYLTDHEIRDIIENLSIENIELKELVQHCYALCNYWKENGKGAVEFYHNNIRDFFLCEKIFYELNDLYQSCEVMQFENKTVDMINERLYDLLRYMKLPQKVVEFLYLRTMYKSDKAIQNDFPVIERKKRYLPYFFTDMLLYGGVSHYDRSSGENVYSCMVNTLFNIVQIFRHIYEAGVIGEERILWWINKDNVINQAEILKNMFNQIFISTPLTFENSIISLAGKAHFNSVFFDNMDLRYVDFSNSNLEGSVFSNSIIWSASFEGCNLKKCNFKCADLTNASLLSCDMEECILDGAILVNTVLPDGFQSDVQQLQEEHLKMLAVNGLRI